MRIFINLYHKLYRVLVYPLSLLARRGFGLVVMGGVLYVLIQLVAGEDSQPSARLAASSAQQSAEQASARVRLEDGNSSFAADLLPQMSPEELRYYSQTYYHVMSNQPAGMPYQWRFHQSHGTLTPAAVFKNNYGHRCRRFEETLKVQQVQQKLNGIACEKKGGGWCKLGAQFTPICGIKPKTGIGSWWDRAIGDLF